MTNFTYIQEFFDTLNFDIEIIHQNNDSKNEEPIYSINNERVFIQVKNEVRPQSVTSFIHQKDKKIPLLIASKYITPKAKNILKENNINYIDSFGNAFIHFKNLKIFIEQGNAKPTVSNYSNILTQASAQVIFQLLKNPAQINETQRYLAHTSKVSLGSVSKCMKALLDEGFVVKWNKEEKYQLVRREELLEKWEEGWQCLFTALDSVNEDNFDTIVYIRNQGHTITEAINRQFAHYAYHVGQIVFLAKMIKDENWKSLSIPKGASKTYNKEKFAQPKRIQHFTDEFLEKK